MATFLGTLALCAVFTLLIYIKDKRRRAKYEAWKKEKGLTTEDCGI
jgi:hypothetical protein